MKDDSGGEQQIKPRLCADTKKEFTLRAAVALSCVAPSAQLQGNVVNLHIHWSQRAKESGHAVGLGTMRQETSASSLLAAQQVAGPSLVRNTQSSYVSERAGVYCGGEEEQEQEEEDGAGGENCA
ncbi:unnamed protein product [Pleuronectes platessa]|uniref:Uncharacterized protein n=1 Tax=Pleuronectes platessa TaxID=8262 RepID=A0A9N7VMT5_PLEPL|nr:unnamed protein product [Pleuronectes platessa]